jgi:hypothetical protein
VATHRSGLRTVPVAAVTARAAWQQQRAGYWTFVDVDCHWKWRQLALLIGVRT